MLKYPFPFGFAQNVPGNLTHPNILIRLQTFQQMIQASEYPLYKQQKLDSGEPSAAILDPDVFFKNEADFHFEEEHSQTYQTTEESNLSVSPTREQVYSSCNEALTPEESPLEAPRKVQVDNQREEDDGCINNSQQLMNMISSKLCPENTGLAMMIEQVFQGRVSSTAEMIGLTPLEEWVVDAVLQKKDFAQKAKKQKGKKREEEKQKFFFKNLLKYTETKFFESENCQKKRTKKKQLKKEAYYDFYWGEVAKEQNISLSNFFHPNKKLTSGKTNAQISLAQNPGLKSLNTTYIDLILSSEKFKAVTIDYLENVFLQEARISRSQKISKLLSKLSSLATEAKNRTANLPVAKQIETVKSWIYDYLVVNPKSKLPWADCELQEARDFAYGAILRQTSKNGKYSF